MPDSIEKACACVCIARVDREYIKPMSNTSHSRLCGSSDAFLCDGVFSETVLEASGDILEVAHPASTGSLSALSLLAPFI